MSKIGFKKQLRRLIETDVANEKRSAMNATTREYRKTGAVVRIRTELSRRKKTSAPQIVVVHLQNVDHQCVANHHRHAVVLLFGLQSVGHRVVRHDAHLLVGHLPVDRLQGDLQLAGLHLVDLQLEDLPPAGLQCADLRFVGRLLADLPHAGHPGVHRLAIILHAVLLLAVHHPRDHLCAKGRLKDVALQFAVLINPQLNGKT